MDVGPEYATQPLDQHVASQIKDHLSSGMGGTYTRLCESIAEIHAQINVLEELLGPVLRYPTPMAALSETVDDVSGLDEQVRIAGNAISRLRALRERLVI